MFSNSNNGMICYAVGEKYDKVLAHDGAVFEIHNNLCFCSIGLSDVSETERKAVESGAIDINLCSVHDIIFVCVNVGDVLFFDMPFNMGLYQEFMLKSPNGYGYLMPIILIENTNNIIKAMRMVGLSADFSKALYELSKRQWNNKMPDYDEILKQVYSKYSQKEILKLSIEKCNFGEKIR